MCGENGLNYIKLYVHECRLCLQIDDAYRIKLMEWRELAIAVEQRSNGVVELAQSEGAHAIADEPLTKDNQIPVEHAISGEDRIKPADNHTQAITAVNVPPYRSSPRNLSKEFLSITTADDVTFVAAAVAAIRSPGTESTASSSTASGVGLMNDTMYLSCQSNNCVPSEPEGAEAVSPPPRLVRSNSYTLEHPSDMFIKHMESKGIDVFTDLSDLSSVLSTHRDPIGQEANLQATLHHQSTKSDICPAPTVHRSSDSLVDGGCVKIRHRPTTNEQMMPRTNRKHEPPIKAASFPAPSASSQQKVRTPILSKTNGKVHTTKPDNREDILRRIYGGGNSELRTARSKQWSHSQQQQQQLSPQVCVIPSKVVISKKPKTPVTTSNAAVMPKKPSKNNLNEYNRLLQLVEERHTQQMHELMQRQQSEQRRLQLEFAQQQEILSQQISQMMVNNNRLDHRNGANVVGRLANDSFDLCKRSHTSIESIGHESSSMCECDETESDCM